MQVIAVDDEPSILELYPMFLNRYGIQVTTFESANEALVYLQEHTRVDAIISDVDMPVCDGIEFFNLIKESKIQVETFIFVTGKWRDDMSPLLKEGVNKVYHKPFPHQEIAQYLKGVQG